MQFRNLLGIEDLTKSQIEQILALASRYADGFKNPSLLADKTVMNLFFENSTRTLISFELAAKKLGALVVNVPINFSSVKKGETLRDTILTLNAMKPDFIVLRHSESGAAHFAAANSDSAVIINAGDGSHEHPTQALLDALTLQKHFGHIEGLVISICGDILHSRVARSNMILLKKLGAIVKLIAPPTLLPADIKFFDIEVHHDLKEALHNSDAVMMLRIQQERMETSHIPSIGEFFKFYALTREKLGYAKKNIMVTHPGPINRSIEIASDVADDSSQSLILTQVTMGIAVRQAVFEFCLSC